MESQIHSTEFKDKHAIRSNGDNYFRYFKYYMEDRIQYSELAYIDVL